MKFKVKVMQTNKYMDTTTFIFGSWEETSLFCSIILRNEVPSKVEISRIREGEENEEDD